MALTPDNYLVSPQITLGGSITFWASAYSSDYPSEHFGVAVSEDGINFTMVQEWTMTAKGEGSKAGRSREGGNRFQGNWYQYTADLSAYSGLGYVAIRHFNCSEEWRLIVDDITIVQPNSSWTAVNYAINPYTLTNLTPGTQYQVKVRSNCVEDHYSNWAYTTFTTETEVITQTNNLVAGWNWFSTHVEITLDDLKAALVEALPGTAITVKSRTENTAYNPNTHRWMGTLNTLDVTQMYMIYVSSGCEITLVGTPVDPTEHPVTISNGTNWIAFPLGENMTISDAFAGFAVNGDKVKSRASNTQYFGGSWRGLLTTLVPGQGYMYISNTQAPRTFTFPISTK